MRSSSSLGKSEAWSDLEESNSSKGVSHRFAWGRLFFIRAVEVGGGGEERCLGCLWHALHLLHQDPVARFILVGK